VRATAGRRVGQGTRLAAGGPCGDHLDRPGLGAIAAEIGDDAIRTIGLAGDADISPVQDQPVVRVALVFRGGARLERHLDRKRCLAWSETGAVGDPKDMRVDRDRRLAEGHVQHHVRGLASNAGQRLQGRAVTRNLAAMLFDQDPAQRDQVLCLGAEKPDRADQLDHPLLAERQHLLRRVGEREERRRRLVDAGVRRLRRQHDRDQQGEWVDEFQLGLRDRPCFGQPPIEFPDLAFGEGAHRVRV